jgi:diguanylate cyclase (GGDEF)-like protein
MPNLAPATRTPACVLQIYGGTLGRRFELGTDDVLVGRDEDVEICLDLTTISRRHARLYTNHLGWFVEDLGSTNGTRVNDELIADSHQLHNGDHLGFGGAVFKFIGGGNIEALYHEEIYRLTITDGLTGAATKRAFVDFLERELVRATRHSRRLALVMLDVDHFKQINDQHGHLAGDHVLRGLVSAIQREVRSDELFARYGGDEFVVVLPETDGVAAARFCERIRTRVEALRLVWRDQTLAVTISIGAAVSEKGDDLSALVARADARLYAAKQAGRNASVTS